MKPFDSYPEDVQEIFSSGNQSNCRQGYGHTFITLTKETHCAYCGMDLTESYRAWLTMVLDHVVPKSVCKKYQIPPEFSESLTNFVLACAACNGFCNRYYYKREVPQPVTKEVFYRLRDEIFEERTQLIASQHQKEEDFFRSNGLGAPGRVP